MARPLSWLLIALPLACPAVASAQVLGTVRDALTQAPVAGARVSVQASNTQVASDVTGVFALPNVAGAVTVVAAKKGYFNAGLDVTAPATSVDLLLDPVPTDDDPAAPFREPLDCINCHPQQVSDWMGSAMSRAGTNSWVYDTYDGTGTQAGDGGFVYVRDSVLAAANPASECRSCHQPEGWVLDPYSPLEPVDVQSPSSLHGIGCEMCHKMANIDETKPNAPGMWPGVVTLRRPQGFQVEFGVLGDVDFFKQDEMRASYQPQLSAALCAACHQDKNDPDLDGDFEEDNGVVSEPTYIEWLASPYADPSAPEYATCVDCHMPTNNAKAACVDPEIAGMDRPPGDIRSHFFAGTTPPFLENAVTMTLDVALDGDTLAADVVIVNDKTGHHVPTGVTIRNMILVVEAWREGDGAPLAYLGEQLVHDLGGVGDPEQGYFAGLPGKLYAKVNHDQNGQGPTFFTDAAGITFDTRIAALATDATHYAFELPPDGGDIRVRARLVYRRSWRALTDAKSWVKDGHGMPLEDLAPPYFGHPMEAIEKVVSLPTTCDGGPCPECTLDDDCPDGERCDAGSCVPDGSGDGGTSAGGSGAAAPPPAGSDDGGCGCRVGDGGRAGGWIAALIAAAALALRGKKTRSGRAGG